MGTTIYDENDTLEDVNYKIVVWEKHMKAYRILVRCDDDLSPTVAKWYIDYYCANRIDMIYIVPRKDTEDKTIVIYLMDT